MPVSRLLFAAIALGFIACAFVVALLPQPWRTIFLLLTAVLAGVVAYGAAAAPGANGKALGAVQKPADEPDRPSNRSDLLEALPLGIIMIGPDARIREFNAAAATMFHAPSARPHGRALIEVVRSFELERRLLLALREGVEETAELSYSAAYGRRLQVTTRSTRNAAGQPEALAIIMDLTRLRELEAQRRDIVSNVSHELRTPLTAIKLMVETLQSGVDPNAAGKFLTSIGEETERMIMLVEDLLDLTRLETGKLNLRCNDVDVGALCREAVGRQLQRAKSLHLELECTIPGSPLILSADRDKLYRVLVNLLDNALRHTPPGGRVSVSAARENGSVNIVVQDTGTGIPSTALPHIFERFYVVDAARAHTRSGTGLGLAIVKHILEAHGGSINVESEVGKGSVFRCRLRA